ncbi:hypothetical protein SAMD00023353_0201980 [Rosellinia necatrix]|uniref:Uncharacterized protein n=1 Tax=Rosellinia necatrix TaxID=77044 RepID=A0A1S8A4X9_ROSNE|nr:hypothetical protein SAMD00023353_0201980 [Rosellinia necatrix]
MCTGRVDAAKRHMIYNLYAEPESDKAVTDTLSQLSFDADVLMTIADPTSFRDTLK